MRRRRIIHLDMDAFYASVETLDDPSLRGKALLVGGSGARSVVCAASYEARKYGARSAMPMRRARALCPQAVCIRPRMERYAEISRGIFAFLEERAPLVERMSVDEGYLDVSDVVLSDEALLRFGEMLKEGVQERFGLICSVGAAPCKFVAKIASDLEKPDALVVVPEDRVLDFLASLEVGRIPGVGKVGARKLREAGVETIGQLRGEARETLVALFGRWGEKLFDYARGIDARPVVTHRERKSVGSEHTFETDVMDLEILREAVRREACRAAAAMTKRGLLARTATVKVRYGNFEMVTRRCSFDRPLTGEADLTAAALELLERTEAGRRPVRLVGVSASGFETPEATQEELPLFPGESEV